MLGIWIATDPWSKLEGVATSEKSHYFSDSQSPNTVGKKKDWDFTKLSLAKSPELTIKKPYTSPSKQMSPVL